MDPTEEFEERLRRGFFGRVSMQLRLHTARGRTTWIAIVSAGLVALFCIKGGPWFIERAAKSDADCSNRNYDKEPGASLSCDGRAKWWLVPAKLIPWTRKRAIERELRILSGEQDTRIKLAAQWSLDPAMRDANLDGLFDTVSRAGYPADLRTRDWVFAVAAGSGAREKVATFGEYAKGSFDRPRAIRAAVALGDLARAQQLAAIADPDPNAWEYGLIRGSLLCLLGNAKDGGAALNEGVRVYANAISGSPYDEALLASLACTGTMSRSANDYSRDAVRIVKLLGQSGPAEALRILGADGYNESSEDNAVAFFAAAYAAGAIKDPEHVVNYAATMRSNLSQEMSLWLVRGPRSNGIGSAPVAYDPRSFETSADKLEALLSSVERGDLELKPLGAEEDLFNTPWRLSRKELRAGRKDPIKTLRRLALIMRVNAIVMYGAMFDATSARRVYEKLPQPQTEGAVGLIVGSNLARLGETKHARVMFRVAAASGDSLGRVYGELSIALLDLSEGRPRDALASVDRAARALGPAHADVASSGLANLFDARRSVGWVMAAAALLAGEASVTTTVKTPTYFEATNGPNPSLPTDWFALARADDRTRQLARFRMFAPTIGIEERAVLPAVIYVLREVARDGKDPNVWIDFILPIYDKELNGAAGMRARADAARWRGANDEASAWDGRAQKLEKLITTPAQSLLARFAGIY